MIKSRCRTALFALAATLAVGALTASSAFASGKPFVETKPASSIAAKEATLNGIVNPNGAETKYHFDYGTSVLYGKKTTEVSVGAGTSNVEVSRAITELTSNTTYHFRIVATNANGTTNGADQVFSTTAVPGLPEFSPASKTLYTVKGSLVSFRTTAGLTYTCTASKGDGEITGAKSATAKLTFTGCGTATVKCQSEGAQSGEIKTGTLPVELVYVSKEHHEAGLVFNFKASAFATWACNGTAQGIRNSIVATLSPVNASTTSHTVTFAETTTPGIQNPTQYENDEGKLVSAWAEMQIVSSAWLQGSLVNQLTLTTPEPLEVKA
jgi:hypothetical protein